MNPLALIPALALLGLIYSSIVHGMGGWPFPKPTPTPTPSPTASISMDAARWDIQFSPNMPAHPLTNTGGTGWQFDFPSRDGVHYVTTRISGGVAGTLRATIQLSVTGSPEFKASDTSGGCNTPANTRFYMQQAGDNMTAAHEDYRWWSNPTSYTLAPTTGTTLSVAIDPSQWTQVFGRLGTERPTGWNNAIRNLQRIGWTFSGGCFFGHGAYVINGTARFINTAENITRKHGIGLGLPLDGVDFYAADLLRVVGTETPPNQPSRRNRLVPR